MTRTFDSNKKPRERAMSNGAILRPQIGYQTTQSNTKMCSSPTQTSAKQIK